MSMEQTARAQRFHQLHSGGRVLVLPNAWDAASARIIEQAGAPAIATTSAGMAWSLGFADGERLPVEELLAACSRICRRVSVPVSVDIERGYGQNPEEVAVVVGALLKLGIVGVNIEDGVIPGTHVLASPSVLGERIAAIRAVAQKHDVRLFINARTDTYFVPNDDPAARLEDTVQRALLYVAAGADGIFVPGLAGLDEIVRIAKRVPRPLNIYAGYAGVPQVAELLRAGVRRVSLGCGPLQAVMALTRRMAQEAIDQGSYTAMTENMLSAAEANSLFTNRFDPPQAMRL
ncbi:MAG: isocitrate lyase/PEP mutase family protein [Nevskiales bacterium]